ncbi:hypothetical protein BGZ90_006519 [Linnemannia elongata]|nr:hypothetical protein BGZ90_006519 [Linnemannia elongata]
MTSFPGVKRANGSNAFYYDDNDIKMIDVPVGQCEGSYILNPDELKKHFGVDPARMGKLPEYFIAPRLDTTWNTSRSESTGRSWWDITGEVVAYRPIAWIPIVRELRTIPRNHLAMEFEKTTTTIQTSEIYGKFETSFTLSVGGGWKGIKAELSSTTSIEASYKTSWEDKETIIQRGKIGDVVVKEVVMGMSLRVERVYERAVHVYLNDEKKGDSLTWNGPESWGDCWVAASALRDVKALQFHPISMTGSGYRSGLFLQVLPAFNADKKLTDLHLVMSCSGWTDWYTYTGGSKTINGGRVETLPMPDNSKPLVTFIAID